MNSSFMGVFEFCVPVVARLHKAFSASNGGVAANISSSLVLRTSLATRRDLYSGDPASPLLMSSQPAPTGPYALLLAIRDGRLVFDISTEGGEKVGEFHLSLGPFRQVVKDYFQICASYYDAVKTMPPAQIEAIDMARRGIHNEGARTLQERLEGKAEVDTYTARRLFTLICALIPQG